MASTGETRQAATFRHLQATNLKAYTATCTHYKSSHQPLLTQEVTRQLR